MPPVQGPRANQPLPPPREEVHTIHTIVGGLSAADPNSGGRKAYAQEAHQHQICLAGAPMAKKPRVTAATLTFSNKDARVLYPHTDALVVSLQIFNFVVHRVLIDNGSSADILYLSAMRSWESKRFI